MIGPHVPQPFAGVPLACASVPLSSPCVHLSRGRADETNPRAAETNRRAAETNRRAAYRIRAAAAGRFDAPERGRYAQRIIRCSRNGCSFSARWCPCDVPIRSSSNAADRLYDHARPASGHMRTFSDELRPTAGGCGLADTAVSDATGGEMSRASNTPFFQERTVKNQQSRVLDTVHHVQDYLDSHATVIGPAIASARRSLDSVDTNMTAHADAQIFEGMGSRGDTSRLHALRRALRNDHMRPIAEVARQRLRDVPEFSALNMPRKGATATQLVVHANAMVDGAAVHEAVFTDAGLPDDFVASLRSAADTLSTCVTQRNEHVGRRAGATAGLGMEAKRARSTIRLIDAIIRPKLGSDDALLGEWDAARRVPRKRGVPAGSGGPSTTTDAPPGSTVGSITPSSAAVVA